MRGRRLALIAVACGVVGAGLAVLVESPLALGIGIALMVAFIAIGTAAIATPEYLGRDDDWRDGPGDS
ncbi:MAG: hypothetical protein AB7O78_07680 [Thermoleophilia bacterium]